MNLRTITRILIIPGALLLGLGFFMDVTVDSDYGPVVNFHKQSRQMTYLISGGSLLIAGVVLYGFRKLKQSPEEELEERKRAQEVERKAREKLVAVKGKSNRRKTRCTGFSCQALMNSLKCEYWRGRLRHSCQSLCSFWLN